MVMFNTAFFPPNCAILHTTLPEFPLYYSMIYNYYARAIFSLIYNQNITEEIYQ